MGIGTRVQYSEVSLSAGNVISDGKSCERLNAMPKSSRMTEPGYYEEGNFGIRIES